MHLKIQKFSNHLRDLCQNDKETPYISAYECNLEEFHYQITSNFEQICELIASKHLSSSIKPFMTRLEKLFNILVTRVILKPDTASDKSPNYLLTQPVFLINYEIREIMPLSHLRLFDYFDVKDYKLIDEAETGFIEFESAVVFERLSTDLVAFLSEHDKTNNFKLLVYLVECLATRLCLGQDGLNCVQLALQMDSLLKQLIDRKQYILVSYLLLDVIFKNIAIQVDYIQSNKSHTSVTDKAQDKILNGKLKENQFFLSNFMGNRIESSFTTFISVLEALNVEKLKSQNGALLRLLLECNLSRILSIITTVLVKKLNNFDSLIKFNFAPTLRDLIVQFNRLNETSLVMKCVKGAKCLHSLSLIPFYVLTDHYKEQRSRELDELDKYSDLDVITKNCTSAWNFYNVKTSFCLARKVLLNYEADVITSDMVASEEHREMSFVSEDFSTDDKNIYRDFTLKLADSDIRSTGIGSKFFGIQEANELANSKLVNLTSFILAFRFHLYLMSIMKDILCKLEMSTSGLEIATVFLDCFNQTYIVSLRMDRILSLKILLSKIFCLNHENNMANFINMFKSAYAGINVIFFKYFIRNLHSSKTNYKDIVCENYDQLETLLITFFHENKLGKDANQMHLLVRYFSFFSQHFSMSYLYLNQTSHAFTSDRNFAKFLKNVLPQDIEKDGILSMLLEFYKPLDDELSDNKLVKVISEQKSLDSNDLGYLLKDSQFEYKIWSNEIVNLYVLGLLGYFNETESNIDAIFNHYTSALKKPEWFNSSIKLIAVLNACATTHHGCFEIEPHIKKKAIKLLEDMFVFYKDNSTQRNEE